ncbi:biopolymer transporter ExbD [bacterium]|nr:MAG: biopolymer transporter ExbD [bacterium]
MKLPRTEMKKARIEIIPMIDAIFFLLVFFMMTSLSLTQLNSEKVKLPESTALQLKPEGEKVVVTATKDGKFYIDQRDIQLAQLVPLLTQQVNKNPQVTVILNFDRNQQMAQFTRVFDLVKQANPANVMLASTPKDVSQLPASGT